MNGNHETKSEIRARIEELQILKKNLSGSSADNRIREIIDIRTNDLKLALEKVSEDMVTSSLSSHKTMCEIKNMGEMEAFGHDPTILYALGLSAECS